MGSAIWKVVSGTQVKTTQTSTEVLRFWRKRLTLGVWTDKRFRPWDPNNLTDGFGDGYSSFESGETLTVSGRSPVVLSLLAACSFSPAGSLPRCFLNWEIAFVRDVQIAFCLFNELISNVLCALCLMACTIVADLLVKVRHGQNAQIYNWSCDRLWRRNYEFGSGK